MILNVKGLSKSYPAFELKDISLSLEKGRIMGLIGRNGAGKSTTVKSILGIVRPDRGHIEICGMDFAACEREIKQKLGYASGETNFYKKKKLKDILAITAGFYDNWNPALCEKYMRLFDLDGNKCADELSQGMRVKFSLIPALSHNCELLILDEPTSGLDPVSRNELLEIFKYLREKGISILFSTHIISNLENCADDISYIRRGSMVFSGSVHRFIRENGGRSPEEIMLTLEKEALYEKFHT